MGVQRLHRLDETPQSVLRVESKVARNRCATMAALTISQAESSVGGMRRRTL